MAIIATGIDLAKNVVAVHRVNEAGAAQLRQPKVTRAGLNALVASLAPCLVAMQACPGALLGSAARSARVHIRTMAKDCAAAQQLIQLMGGGETTATALVAMVGNAGESTADGSSSRGSASFLVNTSIPPTSSRACGVPARSCRWAEMHCRCSMPVWWERSVKRSPD